jgi:rhomboid family GlyGly-CTERM serine protease
VAVAAVLALPALVVGPADALALRLLAWRPELALSEPWRWWSAAWVHLSPGHLAADLAGALLVAALGWLAALPPRAAWAWALAWPLTHLTLSLQPELQRYAGLSGVLYAGVTVLAVGLISAPSRPRLQRALALLLLLGLLLRLGVDRSWDRVVYRPEGWAFSIAPLAHAGGVAWGAALAGLAEWLHRRRGGGA